MSLRAWAAGTACMAALDLFWLGVLAKGLYRAELGHLMGPRVRWEAAGAFYLLYGAGIAHYALRDAGTVKDAALQGALLGLFAYGVYDLTNLALLRGWTVRISLLDVAWGASATALAACAARAATSPR